MTMYIGIDIGGTSIKCGLVDAHGHISRKVTRPTATAKVDIMADLVAMIQGLQADGQVAGIGVSMPGVVQSDGFLTTAGAVTAFEKINLQAELHAQTQLPVIIENDANAAAIAEQWLGVAQNVPNYLSLVLGTGVHTRVQANLVGWLLTMMRLILKWEPLISGVQQLSVSYDVIISLVRCRLLTRARFLTEQMREKCWHNMSFIATITVWLKESLI